MLQKFGISDKGRIELEHLKREFRVAIWLCTTVGYLQKSHLLKIPLKPNSVLICPRQQKYSPEKRKFIERFVDKLLAADLWWQQKTRSVCVHPTSQPKDTSNVSYGHRQALNQCSYRSHILGNARHEQWTYRCRGVQMLLHNWPLVYTIRWLLQKESQLLHALRTLCGVVYPMCSTQGAINSSANFPRKVEPCLGELRHNFEACTDDFIEYEKNETDVLSVLSLFLK